MKDQFQTQVYRVQRVAAPMSLVLLTLNLSLTAYGFVAWRGVNPYLGIGLIFLLVAGGVLLAANLNIILLRMHVHERRVANAHNPNSLYAFTPKELMMQRQFQVPMLRSLGLDKEADRLERWNRLGYIPREDYHPDLLAYYRDEGCRV